MEFIENSVRCLRPGGGFFVKVCRGSDFDAYVATVRREFATGKVAAIPV